MGSSEFEANGRISHREPLHRSGHALGFGSIAFQELQPCWRRREKVAHLDGRASRPRGRHDGAFEAVVNSNRDGQWLPMSASE